MAEIRLEDFHQAMQQLYPDQTARVIAELRAQAAEQEVAEMRATLDRMAGGAPAAEPSEPGTMDTDEEEARDEAAQEQDPT